ncbi:hypothetical protein SAMN05421833_12982 [Microbispora rosea]|uniref:Uncharacterized protein n=1 Tax=Microbispora rosea TaxID=58117 RepID=A0A1N7GIV8_9ACTN|nr:hypothetical protein [Microbispora rosea]GIH51675.1 hypothetical protein Mro03_68540 [Microbispora rosea subsp. rosea]SIS12533.1 hypothetical protein SAMN05421833_12982 [Microbispora rosea]
MEYQIVDRFHVVPGARLVTRAEYLLGLPAPSRSNTLEYAVAYGLAEMADRTGLIENYHPPRLVEDGHLDRGLEKTLARGLNRPTSYDAFTIISASRLESYLCDIGYLAFWPDDTGEYHLHLALPVDRDRIRAAIVSDPHLFPLLDPDDDED